jgi:hypothetical protein
MDRQQAKKYSQGNYATKKSGAYNPEPVNE